MRMTIPHGTAMPKPRGWLTSWVIFCFLWPVRMSAGKTSIIWNHGCFRSMLKLSFDITCRIMVIWACVYSRSVRKVTVLEAEVILTCTKLTLNSSRHTCMSGTLILHRSISWSAVWGDGSGFRQWGDSPKGLLRADFHFPNFKVDSQTTQPHVLWGWDFELYPYTDGSL
jgi:hypothetical protein